MKTLLILLSLFCAYTTHAQGANEIGYSNYFWFDFETSNTVPTSIGLNQFVVSECVGSGPTVDSIRGSKACYIAPVLGPILGNESCNQYNPLFYGVHKDTQPEEVTLTFDVNAGCYRDFKLYFDYKMNNVRNPAEVRYRMGTTAPWNTLLTLQNTSDWSLKTVQLPQETNNADFQIQFVYYAISATRDQYPLALDNIRLSGMEVVNSDGVILIGNCSDYTFSYDEGCPMLLPDLKEYVQLSPNCADPYTYTQNPPAGTVITDSTLVVIRVQHPNTPEEGCVLTARGIQKTTPEFNCPSKITQYKDSSCQTVMLDHRNLLEGVYTCSSATPLVVTQSIPVGTVLTDSNISFRLVTQIGNNNPEYCTIQIELIDTIAPKVLTCPTNVNVYSSSNCTQRIPSLIDVVGFTDNCSILDSLYIQQTPLVNTPVGTSNSIRVYAVDLAGNESSCVVAITVIDSIKPSINCQQTFVLNHQNDCEAIVPDFKQVLTYLDNCTPTNAIIVNQSISPGVLVSTRTAVEVTLIDLSQNTRTCTLFVAPRDTIKPLITCPPTQISNLVSDCQAALIDYRNLSVATDNCTPLQITQTPTIGTSMPVGTHTITHEVIDPSQNTKTCTFQLEVIDNTTPNIQCPNNIAQCQPLVVYTAPEAEFPCSETVSLVSTHGLESGMSFPIGVSNMEYLVTSTNGNTNSCTFTITIFDEPIIAQVQERILYLCGNSSVIVNGNPSATTGMWTLLDGNATITTPNQPSSTVTNITSGNVRLLWKVSSANCGSTQDTVTIINTLHSAVNILQDTIYACTQNYNNISATTLGEGIWSANTAATFVNPSLKTTSVTNLNFGWNTLYFSTTTAGCPVLKDSVLMFQSGNSPLVTMSEEICYTKNLEWKQPNPVNNSVKSYQWSADNQVQIVSGIDSTLFRNFNIGSNELTLLTEYFKCPKSIQKVTLVTKTCEDINSNILPNLITPNGDGDNDEFNLNGLEKTYPSLSIDIFDRSGNFVYHEESPQTYWNGTNKKGDRVPVGVYFYRINLNDSDRTEIKGSITVMY